MDMYCQYLLESHRTMSDSTKQIFFWHKETLSKSQISYVINFCIERILGPDISELIRFYDIGLEKPYESPTKPAISIILDSMSLDNGNCTCAVAFSYLYTSYYTSSDIQTYISSFLDTIFLSHGWVVKVNEKFDFQGRG